MYSSINISAVTEKIYVIIENLTDVIEELNKAPSSAQVCDVEGAGSRDEKYGFDDPPEKRPDGKDFDLFRYLSGNEGLELIRLESTKQSLLRAQGFLEEKKQVLIRLARNRQK